MVVFGFLWTRWSPKVGRVVVTDCPRSRLGHESACRSQSMGVPQRAPQCRLTPTGVKAHRYIEGTSWSEIDLPAEAAVAPIQMLTAVHLHQEVVGSIPIRSTTAPADRRSPVPWR